MALLLAMLFASSAAAAGTLKFTGKENHEDGFVVTRGSTYEKWWQLRAEGGDVKDAYVIVDAPPPGKAKGKSGLVIVDSKGKRLDPSKPILIEQTKNGAELGDVFKFTVHILVPEGLKSGSYQLMLKRCTAAGKVLDPSTPGIYALWTVE